MATLTRQVKNLNSVRTLPRSGSLQNHTYEAVNLESLKGIVAYLGYLYNEGEMSNSAYKTLVSQVFSIFVENSVRFKIEQALEEIDSTIEEAENLFLSNI